MKIAYMTNAWGNVMAHCAAANNVNGAYYVSTGSDEEALFQIAKAGYEQIELFDGNLLAYEGREEELQRMLDSNHLSLLAVYSAGNFIYDDILAEELYRIKKAASFARKFGAKHIALGGGATRFDGIREDDYTKLAIALDRVCEIADELSMTANYHPHMGSLVETPEQLDKVMSKSRINLCQDTGHIVLGGGDPAAINLKYIDRVSYIHLKDVTKDGMFCPLGQGVIDFEPIIRTLQNTGRKIDFAIECDGWSGDPFVGATTTYNYLTKFF